MECRELTGFIDAYLDGEFDAVECKEVEAHLRSCRSCQDLASAHAHFKQLVHSRARSVSAPPELKDRILARLEAVEVDPAIPVAADDLGLFGPFDDAPPPPHLMRARLWRAAPLFASAGVLAAFVWMTSGGFASGEVVDDAVSKHARGLPMEVASPDVESIQGWARGKVDFNPRLPVFPAEMRPVGARLSHILDRPAVYLIYEESAGHRRASLFVFADAAFDLGSQHGDARHVGERDVRFANRRGYNVVVWREDEIVYSLVSDLDEASLLRLIESARSR